MRKKNVPEGKKRFRQGFTLTEMLVTVLIMLMSSAILASGIASARRAQATVTDTANAQLLLSTGITVLRHELGTAEQVELEGTTVRYRTSANGSASTILLEADGIKLIQYADLNGWEERKTLLVSEEAAAGGLVLSYAGVTKSDNILEFTGLTVTRDGKELASQDSFKIRTGEKRGEEA